MYKAVLEGLLFVVGEDGLTIEQISDVLNITAEEAKTLIMDLKKDYEREGFHLQRLYKRRKVDPESGVYKSTMSSIMEKQPRGGTGEWHKWF